MKSADLLKELIAEGCELKRHNDGSHQIWWSPLTGKTFPIPHPKKDLPLGTVRMIKKWRGFNPVALEISMLFSVGVETPKDSGTAYGISVPALDNADYGCISAADETRDIPVMAREAILSVIEEMLVSGSYSVEDIVDAGFMAYAADPDYVHCDTWFVIDVDLTGLEGKQQRVNISLPDVLIKRIDSIVQVRNTLYKDRSHFLATAARRELSLK